jgi:hypothetical protein
MVPDLDLNIRLEAPSEPSAKEVAWIPDISGVSAFGDVTFGFAGSGTDSFDEFAYQIWNQFCY